MEKNLFTTPHSRRVNSPEQLNDYIRTVRPNVWVLLAAVIILLCSALVWSVFGNLNTTIHAGGVANGDTVVCYLSNAADIQPGNTVTLGSLTGEVVSVSAKPLSLDQVTQKLDVDEYTLYCLDLAQWNYEVQISLPGLDSHEYVTVNIVTESVSPISFVMG